ncbi:sigma-B regulation protein RsbU (phosphoserine phosphatase) [Malonomonas rubra DSM 5091]|uniref:Sigma-B regulation protein RsbU (Phosphoserine phosphatase) n=1 Tax=Malonomonas rubra DSM 5091 TaxID=1122189 RepID=A0A1M6F552_MALRU|nr:SpoIIE family protein phosphatase [Malonomonas rubra]SHI92801.1 sigma-B regulation protein RsbU (phosphoserine phosphatase) [Malonomonas rubra DSM 5091]
MRIRTKILILLLAIALIPLLLNTFFQSYSTLQLSHKLGAETREQLLENAYTLLHVLVDEYGQILKRDQAQVLLALNLQAREVEKLLAATAEGDPPLYFSADFERPETSPAGTEPSDKHFRPGNTGKIEPIRVNYQQQVLFLANGVARSRVDSLLRKLASMPAVYRLVHDIRPDLFLWQYTALEQGVHSSYPGKGGYPSDYDPRQREWYRAAKTEKRPITRVITDLSTRSLILTMAMPVHTPDGHFAGVTAIDVVYQWLLADWTIPPSLQEQTQAMILFYHPDSNKLEVIYRGDQEGHYGNWRMPVKQQFLAVDLPQQLEPVFADLRAGQTGVRIIRQQGEEVLWAYGKHQQGQPFPLISLPYQQVIAQAERAENYAREQLLWRLQISGLMLCGVVAIVLILTLLISKALTRPVLQLAAAAESLSKGDFDARVTITSGDELEALGSAFNSMGPSLHEREQLKQSLALAREVQQHLLPKAAPQVPGFEIFGHSRYCDGTGGDYYDFLELGEGRLGLAVADVSGHGIGAALLMTTVRGLLRSQAPQLGSDPQALIKSLNQHLVRDSRDDFFATFFYALLDTDQRRCSWVSAGHGPSFYYAADTARARELPSSGIPLGILNDIDFEAMEPLPVAPGDILLIGTDGIWETCGPSNEMFGTDRLCGLLQRQAHLGAADLGRFILHELEEFRGDQLQHDDITMLIVKAHTSDQPVKNSG